MRDTELTATEVRAIEREEARLAREEALRAPIQMRCVVRSPLRFNQ